MNEFAVAVHRSLDVREVMAVAAHELRPLFSCDRVCLLELRGRRFRLASVSGQPGRPPGSRQAMLLEHLVDAVLCQRRQFLFPDGSVELPDFIGRLLAEYWECSQGQMILVEPLFSKASFDKTGSVLTEGPVVAALVIEQFIDSEPKPETIERLPLASVHLTAALANSRKYARLVSIPGLSLLGLILDGMRTRAGAILAWTVLAASLLAGGYFVTMPLEIECHGRLMPIERREVFAGLDGEIIDVLVDEAEQIEAGQTVARLQSHELEKAILEQTGLLKGKLKARDAARAELRGRGASSDRGQSKRDQAQLEIINADIDTIERQLELLQQEQQQLVIRSPISGTVTTERPQEKLLARPVRRGESLLEIMDETGPWQLELIVYERKVGHLLLYRQRVASPVVKFRLHSSAQQSLECAVTRIADRTFPSTEHGSCSLVFCNVTSLNLPTRQIGSEVTAQIQCGRKNLLFIWFHEFWELLQRHWWV